MITKIGNEEKKQLVAVAVKAMKEVDSSLTAVQLRKIFSCGYGQYSKIVKEEKNDKL
jgi:hypothetical protein